MTCRRKVRLANGRELSAVELQAEYLERALKFAKKRGLSPLEEQQALEMWEHVMTHLENDPLKLKTEVDWVIKYHLIEAYRERHDLPLTHPRVALVDLAYHDVTRRRSLYYLLERRGQVDRLVDDDAIERRDEHPAADHPRPPARRVHQAGQGAQARLHGRLGAPEAQRPGPAHGAVQGPVQVARRAGRAPHRLPVTRARGMPSFRTGKVLRLLEERTGLQRAEVDLGDGPERGVRRSPQLTGRVDVGDPVVVNTTAVELGLGTGGWHVVHWNLARDEWNEKGPGHIIKGRYTSLQADVGSTEEHLEALAEVESIDGMPVVAAALHSQVPAVAAAVARGTSRRPHRVRHDRRRRAAARAVAIWWRRCGPAG